MIQFKIDGVECKDVKVQSHTNQKFLEETIGGEYKSHFLSRTEIWEPKEKKCAYDAPKVSQLIQGMHNAFNVHLPLALKPEVFWYAIIHEVAITVKANPSRYAQHFTITPGEKKTIEIQDDSLNYGEQNDWGRSILLFHQPLSKNITPEAMKVFLPAFSTMNDEKEASIMVAFMDVVSEYYQFSMRTDCGIPEIRLEGTQEDWGLLVTHTKQLAEMFKQELSDYFADLIPVLEKINEAASGKLDPEFWKSMYHYGGGSGGPYVDGWITSFFAYFPRGEYSKNGSGFQKKHRFDWVKEGQESFGGFTTAQFPCHMSKVAFNWNYYGRVIPMALISGVIGVDYVENKFLAPSLGFGIVEKEGQ